MGVNWLDLDVDLSPPSSAEHNIKWSCTSIPYVCLHSMYKETFLCYQVLFEEFCVIHLLVFVSPVFITRCSSSLHLDHKYFQCHIIYS